ncbi:MAG: hypothetical protein CMH52_02550 [Myxococcales bacterium]|nr:hypothetical protein [Myxococcales bacterium]
MVLAHILILITILSSPPQLNMDGLRVVSLAPSNTELMFAIGAEDLLVGRTARCNYPNQAESITNVGSLFPANYEKIIGLRPDLILMIDGDLKIKQRLQNLGLKIVVIHPKTVRDIADSMRLLGQVINRKKQADERSRLFLKALKPNGQTGKAAPKILYEVWNKPLIIPGPQTFLADLIRLSGGTAIGGQLTGSWPQVDLEWAMGQNPDFILVRDSTRKAYFLKSPIWKETSAVKKNQVLILPNEDIFTRPGPRVHTAIEWLSSQINSNQIQKTMTP